MSLRVALLLSMSLVVEACANARESARVGLDYGSDARAGAAGMLRHLGPTGSRGGALVLVPSAVRATPSLDPEAPRTLLVGAIFARGAGAESEEGNLALIFQAPDGGLAASLHGSPTLRITVDDAVVYDGSIQGLSLLVVGRGGEHESLMLAVTLDLFQRIAHGSSVRVWMGWCPPFDLETQHLDGMRTLLRQIPDGVRLTLPRLLTSVPLESAA